MRERGICFSAWCKVFLIAKAATIKHSKLETFDSWERFMTAKSNCMNRFKIKYIYETISLLPSLYDTIFLKLYNLSVKTQCLIPKIFSVNNYISLKFVYQKKYL